jgi:hypothetical protein
MDKKCRKYVQPSSTTLSTPFTALIIMELELPGHLSVKNSYTEFLKNPTNSVQSLILGHKLKDRNVSELGVFEIHKARPISNGTRVLK